MAAILQLNKGKRIGLSVLIASIAPAILAQSHCNDSSSSSSSDCTSDSDSSSDSDSDSDSGGRTSNSNQHSSMTSSRTVSASASLCSHNAHSGPHSGATAPLTGSFSSSGAIATSSSLQSVHSVTDENRLRSGPIVGAIVGVVAGLILIALLACILRHRRRRKMYLADKSALRRGGLLAAVEEESNGQHNVNHQEAGKELPSTPVVQQHILRNNQNDYLRQGTEIMTQRASALLSYDPSGPPTSSKPSDPSNSESNYGHDRTSLAVPPALQAILELGEFEAGGSTGFEGLLARQKELEAVIHSEGYESGVLLRTNLNDSADPPPQYREIF